MFFGGFPGGFPGGGHPHGRGAARNSEPVDTTGLYTKLGVAKEASVDEIKRAYRKLALKVSRAHARVVRLVFRNFHPTLVARTVSLYSSTLTVAAIRSNLKK